MQMSTTGIYFVQPVPRSNRNSERFEPCRQEENSLCCNIWKNKPQPFLKWVKRHYLGKGSPKGNFAKVISLASEQETFPEDANLDITISSLQTRYACSETIQTATNRWKEYVKRIIKILSFFLHAPSCIVQRVPYIKQHRCLGLTASPSTYDSYSLWALSIKASNSFAIRRFGLL